MRISDWSSDVCSSDLRRGKPDRASAVSHRLLIGLARFGAGALRQPPAHHVIESRHALRQRFGRLSRKAFQIPLILRDEEEVGGRMRAIEATELLDIGKLHAQQLQDRKSTRLNSSHYCESRMPS